MNSSRIMPLLLLTVCFVASSLAQSDSFESLDSLVVKAMSEQQIPGLAVGIARQGKVLFSKGYGVKTLAAQEEVTPRTLFHIASLTKTVTATAVLQLVDEKLVDLDATVTRYLPYFMMADSLSNRITIRELLTHTSGIPDDFSPRWDGVDNGEDALDDYVKDFKSLKLDFNPGTDYNYSNRGYSVLGDIVATISGETFEMYVKNRVLRPLGMDQSSVELSDVDRRLLASPHIMDERYDISVRPSYPYNRAYGPSSTLHSNVEDLMHYAMMHLNHGEWGGRRILQESDYRVMWSPAAMKAPHMGLGWFLGEYRGETTVYHSGGDPGFGAYLVLLPQRSIAVVVLSNYERGSVEQLAYACVDAALGLKPGRIVVRTAQLDQSLYKAITSRGTAAAEKVFWKLKKEQPPFDFTQVRQLMSLAGTLTREKKLKSAQIVDELNIQTFRPFPFLYRRAAEASLRAGDTAKAVTYYKKVLESNPDNQKVKDRLRDLE